MANVSKPLLGLLAASAIGLVLMMVVFKSSFSGGGAGQSTGTYQSAINKAHQAVATSNSANAREGAPTSTTPPAGSASAGATRSTASAQSSATAPASGHTAATTGRKPASSPVAANPSSALPGTPPQVAQVKLALSQHKVIGLLFYNPSASDDAAVAKELAAAQVAPGVVKIAVPVSEVAQFPMVTANVPVTSSPTLLFIDSTGQATPLVGFADRFEIAQRLNALAAQ